MEFYILDNGKDQNNMEKANKYGQMELIMKDISKTDYYKDLVD